MHYAVGPPMMMHLSDLKKVFPLWVKFMYPVFEAMPGDIQADMCAHFRRAGTDANRLDGPHARRYAYSIACAHLKLPHLVFDNYMVSSPNTRGCVCFSLSRVGVGHRLQTRYEQRKLTARARARTHTSEAWPFVRQLHSIPCSDPHKFALHKPALLHIAQRYDSQLPFMFHKGHVRFARSPCKQHVRRD